MDKEALVSVIMPTYNREKILPRSINSVIKQTYKNWELIVVDDRSTDNTKGLVAEYSKKDNRIRYVLNNHRKGPAGARNCGIDNIKGKYIAFLDSDDEWMKHHLKDSVNVLETEHVKVCLSLWCERRKGKVYRSFKFEKRLKEIIKDFKPRVKNNLIFFDQSFFEYVILFGYAILNGIFIYHINSVVIKKESLKELKGFNETLFTAEDVDFFLRLSLHFRFCLIRDLHFIYNQGTDNLVFFEDAYKLDNPKIIKKQNFHQKSTIRYVKLVKRQVKKNEWIKKPKKCIDNINKNLAHIHLFLSIVNKKTNKIKSFFHYLAYCYYLTDYSSISSIYCLILRRIGKGIYFIPQKIKKGVYFVLRRIGKGIYFIPQKINMYIGRFGLFLKRKNPKMYYFLKNILNKL